MQSFSSHQDLKCTIIIIFFLFLDFVMILVWDIFDYYVHNYLLIVFIGVLEDVLSNLLPIFCFKKLLFIKKYSQGFSCCIFNSNLHPILLPTQ